MRATVMYGAGDVRVEDVPDARLIEPTDALVRVTRAAICGSDLWPYKSMPHDDAGRRMGHEFIGVVEAVGSDVATIKAGDLVVSPFLWSDGSCVFCREGLQSECLHGGRYGWADVDGGQGEAVRVPQADGTLVVLPVGADDALMPSLLTLTDVMGTGHHAALAAKVGPGKTVAVVGDGAVGLCGVIAVQAARRRADHPARQQPGADRARPGVRRHRRRARARRGSRRARPRADRSTARTRCSSASASSRRSRPRSRSPGPAVRSVASASPSTTRRRPASRSGRTPRWPAARPRPRLHRGAAAGRARRAGSSRAASSTAPARSRTCRTATAR